VYKVAYVRRVALITYTVVRVVRDFRAVVHATMNVARAGETDGRAVRRRVSRSVPVRKCRVESAGQSDG